MSKKPEIIVFAGPNGSGKSTITNRASIIEPYINADDIKRSTHFTDKEAAEFADMLRDRYVEEGRSFSFETVLSTERKLIFLKKAKEKGYFIRCYYVLTSDYHINISRVIARVAAGGHDVPADTIKRRYKNALLLIPQLADICDIMHIIDNTDEPFRIFKKRKTEAFLWENEFWDVGAIKELVGIK